MARKIKATIASKINKAVLTLLINGAAWATTNMLLNQCIPARSLMKGSCSLVVLVEAIESIMVSFHLPRDC